MFPYLLLIFSIALYFVLAFKFYWLEKPFWDAWYWIQDHSPIMLTRTHLRDLATTITICSSWMEEDDFDWPMADDLQPYREAKLKQQADDEAWDRLMKAVKNA